VVTSRREIRGDPVSQPPHAWETERNRCTDRIVACCHAVACSSTNGEDIPREQLTVISDGLAHPAGHASLPVKEYEEFYSTLGTTGE
jgi:hypothetical protein